MIHRRTFLLSTAGLALAGPLRAAPRVEKDVVYSRPDADTTLLMDLYLPPGRGPHPAVVLVHGGGWLGGSKAGYERMGPWLAENGFVGCAINYRLAPKHPYPAAMDDCHRAVRWIRAHAKEHGLDSRHVGALGDSAGAHLVALIGVRDARKDVERELRRYRARPDAVVSNYGAHELVRMWKIEMAHRPLTAWLGGAPEQRPTEYRDASPVSMVSKGSPPFLILHGNQDKVNPEEQSRLLHAALREKGVDSTLQVIDGAGHGWAPGTRQAQEAETATLAFLRRHLRR